LQAIKAGFDSDGFSAEIQDLTHFQDDYGFKLEGKDVEDIEDEETEEDDEDDEDDEESSDFEMIDAEDKE